MSSQTTKPSRKRQKISPENTAGDSDLFESLPDDLVLSILSKLSSTATSPSDFINVLITCKRLNALGLHSLVLSKASHKTFSVKAKNWCDSSHRFLKLCADAGNIEACYTLGMRKRCVAYGESRDELSRAGSLLACGYSVSTAAGERKRNNDKDLRAGGLYAHARSFLGHIDALRELGHVLQDGYWVPPAGTEASGYRRVGFCPLLSDFWLQRAGPGGAPSEPVMTEWFAIRGGVTRFGNEAVFTFAVCGRPETRKHEHFEGARFAVR
ncbi:F-box-like domain superfamily [Sesbania bispinosa]|nr:F-box-like domain superfamily [Sesbania bispinosa]